MSIYYFTFFAILTLPLIKVSIRRRAHEIRYPSAKSGLRYVIFISLILALLLGLRHPSMGVDLGYGTAFGYLASFSRLRSFSWMEIFSLGSWLNYEIGYILYNKFIGILSSDTQILLISTAAIVFFSIGWIIYENSKDSMLSFIIYLGMPAFLINFSGLRQAIAIAITFVSLKSIRRKKLIVFIALVFLASLFHSSAIVFLVAYPLFHLKRKKWMDLVFVALLPVLFLLRIPLFTLLSRLLKPNAAIDDNGAITLLIVFCLVYCFCLLLGDRKNEEANGYLNLFYVACVCQVFGGVYSIAIRVGYYFMMYLMLLLPEILHDIKSKNTGNYIIIRAIIVICFAAFGLSCLANASWAMTNPYHFFWEQV